MQVLQHLRRCGILSSRVAAANPNPLEQIVLNYAKFLSDQRGLCLVTINNYSRIVQRFLENRFGTGKVCLQELSVGDISRFIVGYSSTAWPGDTRKTATVLRSFLGFLVQDGKITHNLAASVPAVASYRLTKLPMYLEPPQVEKLLSSCDRNSQIGRRDYAVLLLLARLGLRSGEIVHLNLENINWLAGEVLIRGKSVREDRLPLLPEVGQALAEHLKCRQVGSCRRVFLRMKAPYVGFSNSATIGNIFKRALTRARLQPTSKGPRLLRRSLATKMLKAGASLTQIGEVLRHQLAQTTEIYAKVDVTALRALAQPWPGGAR